ncbi:MAG: thioredoxin domain-containing protein [Solirubrobacterales bacterium]|nr:thioredoxin domain-containing protein [Solirubrobacterales bacterium]
MNGDVKSEARPGRIWILLILVSAAVALLVAIAGIATRKPEGEYQKVVGAGDTQRIFGGVRQLGDRLGPEDASVRMQVFLDAQASEFRDQYLETIPLLVNAQVRPGELQMLLRNRSLTRNATELAFYGIEAAGAQDAAWQFTDLMFRNQEQAEKKGRVDRLFLLNLAKSIQGLDPDQWQKDFDAGVREGSAMNEALEAQDKLAIKLGIRAEPAVVVTGPGGTEIVQDAPDLARIEAAISEVR